MYRLNYPLIYSSIETGSIFHSSQNTGFSHLGSVINIIEGRAGEDNTSNKGLGLLERHTQQKEAVDQWWSNDNPSSAALA